MILLINLLLNSGYKYRFCLILLMALNAVWFDVLAFSASIALMWFASGLAVKGVTKISKHLNVSPFVISFVIFGFVSTFPELFISITSAINGVPQLGVATLFGANLIDLTIILGAI